MRLEIKYTIESDTEFSEDLGFKQKALFNAFSNQVKIDNLYSEIFRPVIKYGQNSEEIDMYEKVWLKLYDYFQGKDY